MEALAIWRMFPRQIASDLQRFFHRRIAEWHSGEMSSYELMELFGISIDDDAATRTRTIRVDFAPDRGALASAMRGGERPERDQMLAQAANGVAILRVAMAPDADAAEYGERLFLPISRQREFEAEQLALESERRKQSENPAPSGLFAQWHVQEVS